MDEPTTQFLPFHALNEFMRDEYRVEVVRSTLNALPMLPKAYQTSVEKVTRDYVKVNGFRNSSKAPASLRVKPTSDAFEKKPQVVTAILSAWAQSHKELGENVFALLEERTWDPMDVEADRTKLPGFMISWPKNEDFETIYEAFKTKYPTANENTDDISLMVIWVSCRLPYSNQNDDEEEKSE